MLLSWYRILYILFFSQTKCLEKKKQKHIEIDFRTENIFLHDV